MITRIREQTESSAKRKVEREAAEAADASATAEHRARTLQYQRESLEQSKRQSDILSRLMEQSQDQADSLRSLAKASDVHTAALAKLLER